MTTNYDINKIIEAAIKNGGHVTITTTTTTEETPTPQQQDEELNNISQELCAQLLEISELRARVVKLEKDNHNEEIRNLYKRVDFLESLIIEEEFSRILGARKPY